MSKIVRGKAKNLLDKAKESCILAVDVYNKPKTSFRSGAYIVLMNIAWTSLFHAIFERNNIKYFYKDKKNPRIYEKIDGEWKAWDLKKCVKEYFKSKDNSYIAIEENLKISIRLRNKIEHRFMPELDAEFFGECQSLLYNFEEILIEEFGDKHAINESLAFSLQFARTHPKSKEKVHSMDFLRVKEQIMEFRNNLPDEVYSDQRYSFKAYLLPKLSNNQNRAECAIEWVPYDSSKPEEMAKYNRVVGFIKERTTPVLNLDLLRAREVAKEVREKLVEKYNPEIKFSHSRHHYDCCMHYGIRPSNESRDKRKTKEEFCVYDQIHKDYLYTKKWVKFLIRKLCNKEEFLKIFPSQRNIIMGLISSSKVIKTVKIKLKDIYGPNVGFSNNDHLRCCQYYDIRPVENYESDIDVNKDYCIYEGNNRYLYTQKWPDFLIDKLSIKDEFLKVFPNKVNLVTA